MISPSTTCTVEAYLGCELSELLFSISDLITSSESRIADQNGRYDELAYTNTELE